MNTRLLLPALGLAAICATAACTSTPTGPGEEQPPPPPPPPATKPLWDMTITLRYVVASSVQSCDGTGPFGGKDQGEYQFKVTGSTGTETRTYQTDNYGTALGQMYRLEAGETGNFPDQSWSYSNMSDVDGIALRLYVTEWDALAKDDYMNDRSEVAQVVPSFIRPNGGIERDRTVAVGVSTCGLTLYYDVNITRRDVPVT